MSLYPPALAGRRKLFYVSAALCLVAVVGVGVFARNGWLPRTDPLSGKRTGWLGREMAKDAPSSWNPIAAIMPDSTPPPPSLSKEYIYAGSRLLAVEDANAQPAAPADLAVWRSSTGVWWVMGGQYSQPATQQWGLPTDKAVPGDYDGDGKTDFSVFRRSTGQWWIVNSINGSSSTITFGSNEDVPVQADYDGDGRTDAAIVRNDDPSPGLMKWYILKSSDGLWMGEQFGLISDRPAPADYDGDGKADMGVWRDSNRTFYSLDSSSPSGNPAYRSVPVAVAAAGSVPVSADYDGDGRGDQAVRNVNDWTILKSSSGTLEVVNWPYPSSPEPVQNDYDGDGKVDVAVWSGGVWYIRQSASGNSLRQVNFGIADDIPVPAFYRR